jgi:hypothetical protein
MNRKNPFENEDWFGELVKMEPEIQIQAKKSYQDFSAKNPDKSNNFFMSKYLKITNFITKNAVLATIIMLISLTAVSASATEIFAPTEFKPSTQIQNLFASNQQKDTNPYTSLKPDESNDVVISNQCDLAIKYNKIVDTLPIIATIYAPVTKTEILTQEDFQGEAKFIWFSNNPGKTEADYQEFVKSLIGKEQQYQTTETLSSGDNIGNNYNYVDIFVGPDNNSQEFKNNEKQIQKNFQENTKNNLSKEEIAKLNNTKRITHLSIECTKINNKNQDLIIKKQQNAKKITKQELRELTGWFVTEADINDIYQTEDFLSFKFQDKFYSINANFSNSENLKGIFGNQIQLQFNSLVKNEANVEIVGKQESSQILENSSKSTQTSSSSSFISSQTSSSSSSQQSQSSKSLSSITPILSGECKGFYGVRSDKCMLIDKNTKNLLINLRNCVDNVCNEAEVRDEYLTGRKIGDKYYFAKTNTPEMITYLTIYEYNTSTKEFVKKGNYENRNIVPDAVYPDGESEEQYIEINKEFETAYKKYIE